MYEFTATNSSKYENRKLMYKTSIFAKKAQMKIMRLYYIVSVTNKILRYFDYSYLFFNISIFYGDNNYNCNEHIVTRPSVIVQLSSL